MEKYRKYLVMAVISPLLISCNLVKGIVTPSYEWALETDNILVTSDKSGMIGIIGEKIPVNIEWSAEPSHLVELSEYADGTGCLVKYLDDGEGIITARHLDVVYTCHFTCRKYSDTGLHLKVNGLERYFPMIPHNGPGDGTSKICRIFTLEIPPDTLRLEVMGFIPEDQEKWITLKRILLSENGSYKDSCTRYTHYDTEYFTVKENDPFLYFKDYRSLPPFTSLKGMRCVNYSFVKDPHAENIQFDLTTNAFENGYGKSCDFIIKFTPEQ